MRARPAVLLLALVLAGCTPTEAADPTSEPPATSPSVASTGPTGPVSATPAASASPSASPASPATSAPPVLELSGDAIGDRPLGATPAARLDPELTARLGRPKVGGTQLCQIVGRRDRFAVVDHTWGGLTVRYRQGPSPVALAWTVALDDLPDGFVLADRLPWRPTFAQLEAGGATLATADGRRTARLQDRDVRFSGEAGAVAPDTVEGGPELRCR